MADDARLDRREFVKTSAVAAAGAAVMASGTTALGANGRVQVGVVGAGTRGMHLLRNSIHLADVQVVAVADTYSGWLDRAIRKIRDERNPRCKSYRSHRELLDDRDVQAVIIATPEHSHARIIIDAVCSGRDVYCEKPMVRSWKEATAVWRANEDAGRVIQVGTQRRSSDIYPVAREIVQSGKIGQVTEVRAWWNRNSDAQRPQWRCRVPGDAGPDTCNWPEWLVYAPKRPFDADRYFQWRCYWDYSGGIASDLMVHQVDAINMVMGSSWPASVYGSGRVLRWANHDRETPDTWNAIIEYPRGAAPAAPEGFVVNYSSTFSNEHYGYKEQYLGTDGTLEMNDRELRVYAEPARVRSVATVDEVRVTSRSNHTADHLRNFFDCCKSRRAPNCTERDGAYAAATAHIAVRSHATGRRIDWDARRMRPKDT